MIEDRRHIRENRCQRTNQLNKLNQLFPREENCHANPCFANGLKWSQRPYDAQVVCDTAAGHFDECIWVGNDGLGILK